MIIQGFCFGVIFILTLADLIYKISEFDQVDTNNAIVVAFALGGVIASLW